MWTSRPSRTPRRAATAISVAVVVLVLPACDPGRADRNGVDGRRGEEKSAPPASPTSSPHKGGTLTLLTSDYGRYYLDPQRNYSGELIALGSAYLLRTLTAYAVSPDPERSARLVPDLATDTGTPNKDATSWSWTLKDGLTWEDGSSLTCADVKYGVSRTFATKVITAGPTYALSMLDIPKDKDGTPVYKGPYVRKGNDTAAFDNAVVCTGNTITFNLARPTADFNYTVTLPAFGPVPRAADTGRNYEKKLVSSGPYRIEERSPGKQLVLVRNQHWDAATDSYRGASPDRIVVKFHLDPQVVDQRLIADSGDDQRALHLNRLLPSARATVFGSDAFAARRIDAADEYVEYLAINVAKVPNLAHRKAIAVALDRAQHLAAMGGEFAGDLADGVINPTLEHYAPTGMWTGLLGQPVPDTGDPAYARKLIAASGKPVPTLVYDYVSSPPNDRAAAAVKASLARAGIKVRPVPYRGDGDDPDGHLTARGWAPDWPSASAILPELFGSGAGFNYSAVRSPAYDKKIDAARGTTDRDAEARRWQALHKEALAKVWVVPLRFVRQQRLAGSKVKSASGKDNRVYLWDPYGAWPYPDLYVEP